MEKYKIDIGDRYLIQDLKSDHVYDITILQNVVNDIYYLVKDNNLQSDNYWIKLHIENNWSKEYYPDKTIFYGNGRAFYIIRKIEVGDINGCDVVGNNLEQGVYVKN